MKIKRKRVSDLAEEVTIDGTAKSSPSGSERAN
jgi:hypothetical protein